MIIHVYLDKHTELRLKQLAKETDRTIEELTEAAIAEVCLSAFRTRNDDPAKA